MKIQTFTVGETCLAQIHRNPKVVIMDQMLNRSSHDAANGLAIIAKIKQSSTDTNIILLSAQTELDVFVKALSLYGCTYMLKDQLAFGKVERVIKSIY